MVTDTRRMVQTGGEGGSFEIASESARKLFLVDDRIGVATHGMAMIGEETIGVLMAGLEPPPGEGALGCAEALGAQFSSLLSSATDPRRGDLVNAKAMRWPLGFIVGGFDGDVGRLYEVKVRAGDRQIHLLQPTTENPGIHSFGQNDGIDRLLGGIDQKALRQAKIAVSSEDEAKLELLSYELVESETLEEAISVARSLVEVQFLVQGISRRAYASEKLRIPGCGGEIRTLSIAKETARWAPSISPRNGFPAPDAATPHRERRSA